MKVFIIVYQNIMCFQWISWRQVKLFTPLYFHIFLVIGITMELYHKISQLATNYFHLFFDFFAFSMSLNILWFIFANAFSCV